MDFREVPQQITIKMPFSAGGKEDYPVKALLSWSVKQLKEHLEKSLPNNPSPDSQKLILSGRILQNHLLLKDCFKSVPKDCLPVIHLVCSRPVVESSIKTEEISSPDSTEGLRHRNVAENATSSQTPATEAFQNSSPLFDQQALMFQMYQNYMQQYMMGFGDAATGAAHFPPNTGIQFQPFPQPFLHHATPFPVPQLHPQPHQHHHHPVIAVIRGQNIANMAAAAPVVQEENNNGNWDVLDWGYMLLRVLLLICLIYFYSSTSRFFSAFTMLAIFLVFNTIRDFRRWRERYVRQQRQAQEAAPPAAEAPADRNEEEVPAAADQVPGDAVTPPPVQEEQQHGLISTVLNIVVGFVASLIPENVAHVVAN